MIEIIYSNLKKQRNLVTILVFTTLGAVVGYLSAVYPVYGFILLLSYLGILAVLYFFFKGGRLTLNSIVIPLMIVAVLFPSIRFPAEIPAVRLELIIIILAWTLFILGHMSTGKPLKLRGNPTNKWFILFGICIFLSIAYAAFVNHFYPIFRDFWELGKLIEYFLIFTLVASLNIPAEHMKRYYVFSLIVFLCSAALGFAQYFNLLDMNSWLSPYYAPTQIQGLVGGGRIVGTTGNPNEFGVLMILAASLALTGALWLKGRSIKLFSWAALVVFSLAITFTASRSAILCLLIAVTFIALYKYTIHFGFNKVVRRAISLIPAFLIIAFILLQLAPDLFFLRMNVALDLSIDTSWQVRLVIWENEIDIWKQSPVLGWGPGKATMAAAIDSEWLLLLRRYGLLGVLVLILWFTGVYRTLSSIACETKNSYTETFCTGLEATIIAYAVYMIPSAIYHSMQMMPILLIFLGLTYTQRQSSKLVQP